MTAYRHPYNRKNRPDEHTRPPLAVWLVEGLLVYSELNRSHQRSVRYWNNMYWATPPWLSDEQVGRMKALYLSANPAIHHIDHIVPMSNPLVCGLNVPWNLRKVCKHVNLSKSNNYWPDAPYAQTELFCAETVVPHQMSANL